MSYCYDSGPVRMHLSDDDRAITLWELTEARKDLASLRTRIRFQVQIGCQEGAERLRREYQRIAKRCHGLQDRAFGRGE